MEETHIYQQIAESIRSEILNGQRQPGERLPSVRELCDLWHCTPGTIQRAYRELSREGLVISQAGRGTRVAGKLPQSHSSQQTTLRKASLVHRTENFLLEALTAGYTQDEIQSALDLALDRWRALDHQPQPSIRQRLHFVGSHDLALSAVTRHFFGELHPEINLQLSFSGSLGGLLALKEGKADLAGAHLWDADTDSYNLPFIHKVIGDVDCVCVTFAHRRLGLITAPGNPLGIRTLQDLTRPELRFVNRQAGSGTRVWLDSTLTRMHISNQLIQGYRDERLTHSDVARAVAEGWADVGLGLESAARAFSLDYIHLARERYDLILLRETAEIPEMQAFIIWLASPAGQGFILRFPGYDVHQTGQLVTP